MRFLAKKTCDGSAKGKLAFYCRMLDVSRQGFYDYLEKSRQPWKYQEIADVIKEIRSEDMCNDTYGRTRMRFAIARRLPDETHIPCEATIQKIMREIGIMNDGRAQVSDWHSDILSERGVAGRRLRPAEGGAAYGARWRSRLVEIAARGKAFPRKACGGRCVKKCIFFYLSFCILSHLRRHYSAVPGFSPVIVSI